VSAIGAIHNLLITVKRRSRSALWWYCCAGRYQSQYEFLIDAAGSWPQAMTTRYPAAMRSALLTTLWFVLVQLLTTILASEIIVGFLLKMILKIGQKTGDIARRCRYINVFESQCVCVTNSNAVWYRNGLCKKCNFIMSCAEEKTKSVYDTSKWQTKVA